MNLLILHFFRTYIRIGLFCYYKSFKVYDIENVPKDKPVLFLSNHQNALIDPLLIATKSGRFSYFLTRASVFNKPIISKFLHTLHLLPVYRVRDGWSSISNNNSIFKKCTDLLNENNAIVIFPEGNHHINRTVRPLSKGFTRIVFETLERYPEADLQIIPVGLNYAKAENFVDSTSVYFGKPISVKKYLSKDKHEAISSLKKDVFEALTALTTHIPSENYNETLRELESRNVDFLNPETVNSCIASNFEICVKPEKVKTSFFRRLVKKILIANFFLPFWVWRSLVKPKIKEVEFIATFRFAVYITIFPIWFFVILTMLIVLFGWQLALCYAVGVSVMALYYVKA